MNGNFNVVRLLDGKPRQRPRYMPERKKQYTVLIHYLEDGTVHWCCVMAFSPANAATVAIQGLPPAPEGTREVLAIMRGRVENLVDVAEAQPDVLITDQLQPY